MNDSTLPPSGVSHDDTLEVCELWMNLGSGDPALTPSNGGGISPAPDVGAWRHNKATWSVTGREQPAAGRANLQRRSQAPHSSRRRHVLATVALAGRQNQQPQIQIPTS